MKGMPKKLPISPSLKRTHECIGDLQGQWNNRARKDRSVCGAVELAFMRGYHNGIDKAERKYRPLLAKALKTK